jgi:hypothetical protein
MFQIERLAKIDGDAAGTVEADFVSVKTAAIKRSSITRKFSALNLKDFQEGCRVGLLIPNQIQNPVELC